MLTKHTLLLVVLLSFVYDGFVFAQQQNNDQLDYSISYYTENNGLSQNSVKNISADSEGFIWLTTEAGLVRFDGNSFYTYDKSNLAIPYNRFSMLQPSLEEGNKKARKLYALKEVPSNQFPTKLLIDNFNFISNNIKLIHYDETNKRFFPGSVTKGLFVLKKKRFVTLRTKGNTWHKSESYFYCNNVRRDKRIGKWNLRVQRLFNKPLTKTSLIIQKTLFNPVFKTSKQQEIWMNTYFLLINKKLVKILLDKHKYLPGSHNIIEDKLGNFWIKTNKGIFRFSKRDLLDFAKDSDPPENNSISLMCYTKYEAFHSKNILMEHEVSGKSIARLCDLIHLLRDLQQIKIYLTTAYYANPANLNISYAILKNPLTKILPDEWQDLDGTNPVTSIESLKAGNHTLFIRIKNGFGQGTQTFKKIFLTVPLNWYETKWFQLVALLVLLFLIYFFTRLRFRFIRKGNRLLEHKIARRTQKLEQTYAALEKSEKELHRQIYIQARLIAAMSHDIKTPLKFISASAGRIENMLGNEKNDAVIKLGKMIEHSSVQMYNLLENMITYVKTQVYGSSIVFENINLYDSLSEKLDIFKPVIKEHSNRLINEIDPSLVVWTNPQLLGIVVHNLVDNANKFSFDGIITISTEIINDQLQLIVSDTGPGIPDELILWLNTPSLSDSFEKSKLFSLNYSGLGLTIIKEISSLLEIEIRAEKVQGTKVYLIFPEFKTP